MIGSVIEAAVELNISASQSHSLIDELRIHVLIYAADLRQYDKEFSSATVLSSLEV